MIGKQLSPNLGKSTYSVHQTNTRFSSTHQSLPHRQVLWNVVEPDDPYDIRRSMINRIPHDDKNYMGDNLQIVCLMQAAEIQRLSEFLDDFKYRYRDIERRQLDRHSYEIQIKQLIEKLADSGQFRSQNEKLNEFLKKLTEQLEYYKSRGQGDSELRRQYDSALQELERLRSNQSIAHRDNHQLKQKLQELTTRFSIYQQTKTAQISQLNYQLQTLSSKNNGHNQQIYSQDVQMKERYESQITRMQYEIKRFREQLENKNLENKELYTKNRYLLKQLEQGKSSSMEDSDRNMNTQMMGEEIQKLSVTLKEAMIRLDQVSRNQMEWHEKYHKLQSEYNQLEMAYRQLPAKNQPRSGASTDRSYQSEVIKLQKIIKDLQKEKVQERKSYNQLSKKLSQLEYQYESMMAQIKNQAKDTRDNQESRQHRSKVAELEAKIALLSQELERLSEKELKNHQATVKTQNQYNSLMREFEIYRQQAQEKNRWRTQQYQQQVLQSKKYYEQRIEELSMSRKSNSNIRMLEAQWQQKLYRINDQINHQNILLQQKTDENEKLKTHIRELEHEIYQKYSIETQRKYQYYESTIRQLTMKLDNSARKESQLLNNSRKAGQYEFQNSQLRRQIDELNRRSQGELEGYKGQIKGLGRDNQELRRELHMMVQLRQNLVQSQNRISAMQNQLNNLQTKMRNRIEQNNSLEQTISRLRNDLHNLTISNKQLSENQQREIMMEKQSRQNEVAQFRQVINNLEINNKQLIGKLNHIQQNSSVKYTEAENRLRETQNQLRQIETNLNRNVNQKIKIEEETRKLHLQLQRLTNQNRQMANKLTNTERGNEQNIRNLQDRIRQLEEQQRNQQRQHQRIITHSRQIEEQLNQSNREFQNRSKVRDNEFYQLERQCSRLDNLIKNLEQNRIRNLVNENRELLTKLQNLQYMARNARTEAELMRKNMGPDNSGQSNEWQQHCRNLEQQTANWRNKYHELQQRNQDQLKQMRNRYQLQLKQLSMKSNNGATQLSRVQAQLQRVSLQHKQILDQHRQSLIQLEKDLVHKFQIEFSNQERISEEKYQRLIIQNQEFKTKQHEMQSLRQEIERLKHQVDQMRIVIQNLEGKLRVTQIQNRQLHQQISILHNSRPGNVTGINTKDDIQSEMKLLMMQTEQRQSQLREQIDSAMHENKHLNSIIMEKNQELSKLEQSLWSVKKQFSLLQVKLADFQNNQATKYQEFQQSIRNSRLIEQANSQTVAYQSQITQLNQEYSRYREQQTRQRQAYQHQINQLNQQIEQLNLRIREKPATIMPNQLKINVDHASNNNKYAQLNQLIVKKENRIAILMQEIERLNQKCAKIQKNAKKYELEVNQYKEEVFSLKQASMSQGNYHVEITRLTDLLKAKGIEYEELLQKYNQAIQLQEEYFSELSEENLTSKKHIVHYKEVIEKLYRQFQRLQGIINSLKKQRQQFYSKTQILSSQISTLTKQNDTKETDLLQLRSRLADESSLQKRVQQYMALMVVLFAQIETLRRDAGQRADETRKSIKPKIPSHRISAQSR